MKPYSPIYEQIPLAAVGKPGAASGIVIRSGMVRLLEEARAARPFILGAEYLDWQSKIVREYKRPDQFITHDFSGGIHTNLDQWAIARSLDVIAENPYFETQDRLNAELIWLSA